MTPPKPKLLISIALRGLLILSVSACTAKVLKKDNAEQLLKSDEYDSAVKVSEVQSPSGKYVRVTPEEYKELYPKRPKFRVVRHRVAKIKRGKKEEGAALDPKVHLPDIEDASSFIGRRPIIDPFRVGEKMTFEVSYFGVVAGELSMMVKPFVYVNGHKSYHFEASGKTASVFEMFYAVDDWLETFVDFDTMLPGNYALHVKESKQLRETRCIFNWETLTAKFWDKRITQKDGVEETKYDWPILPYSQNVFSAPFYLRTFKMEPGKKIVYRLAHEKENILVTAEVLRREKITTGAGEFDALVLKPHIEIGGVFKPIGDIFLWVTDDDRHFILRIQSKIKIGTIVAEIKSLDKGRENDSSGGPNTPPQPDPVPENSKTEAK